MVSVARLHSFVPLSVRTVVKSGTPPQHNSGWKTWGVALDFELDPSEIRLACHQAPLDCLGAQTEKLSPRPSIKTDELRDNDANNSAQECAQ